MGIRNRLTGYAAAMTDRQQDPDRPTAERITGRAELLPEEEAAGSEDARHQAEAILQESDERTARPEQTGAESTQTSTPDERPGS